MYVYANLSYETSLTACMRYRILSPFWKLEPILKHANHRRIVLWKGLIVDMILGKKSSQSDIATIDLGASQYNGFLSYVTKFNPTWL